MPLFLAHGEGALGSVLSCRASSFEPRVGVDRGTSAQAFFRPCGPSCPSLTRAMVSVMDAGPCRLLVRLVLGLAL